MSTPASPAALLWALRPNTPPRVAQVQPAPLHLPGLRPPQARPEGPVPRAS